MSKIEYIFLKHLPSAGEYEKRVVDIIKYLEQKNYSADAIYRGQLQILDGLITLEENIRRLRQEQKAAKKNAAESSKKIREELGRLRETDKVKIKSLYSQVDEIDLEIKLNQFMHWMFRYIGDGIAWRVFGFNRSVIRALGGKQPIPFISGRESTEKEIMIFRAIRECGEDWLPIMHDLTNCLRTLDFSIFKSNELFRIFELKIKKGEERKVADSLGKRVDRQVERTSRISKYLETGDMGFLHDDLVGGKSLDVDNYEKHNYESIAEAIESARQNGIGYVEPEPGLLYLTCDNNERLEVKAIEDVSKNHPQVFSSMMTFRSMAPIYNANHLYLPITAMELSGDDIADIIFSRISIICMVNFDCLEKFCHNEGVPLQIQRDDSYRLLVKSDWFTGEVREGLWDRMLLEGLSMKSFAGLIKGIMLEYKE